MASSSFAALSKHGNVIQREFFFKGEGLRFIEVTAQ